MRQWLLNIHGRVAAQRSAHKQRSLLLRLLILTLATISLFAGILLIFLPGPGVLLIALALVLYSLEFHWLGRLADRWAEKAARD